MGLKEQADPRRGPRRGLFISFWVTVIICLSLLVFIFLQNHFELGRYFFEYAFFSGIILLTLSGATLIYLSARSDLQRPLRLSMLWTGISAAGIPVCAVLHNAVYALFILAFGKEFWGQGGDEPVFFLLAIIVLPLVFFVSMFWSIYLIIRDARTSPPGAPPAS